MLPKEDLPEIEESAGKTSRTTRLEGVLQSHPCRPLKSGAEVENPPSIEGLASKANTFPLLRLHVLHNFCVICREIVNVWDIALLRTVKHLLLNQRNMSRRPNIGPIHCTYSQGPFLSTFPHYNALCGALSITSHFTYKLVDKASPSCRATLELMV